MSRRLFAALCMVALGVSMLVTPARASTFTVTNHSDSGAGSLRWAINQANANSGPDIIDFNIPASACMGGICTIYALTALPTLIDDGTTIDGYTQPGTAPATADTPATILIEINGINVTANNGLNIISAGNLVRGLSIIGFPWNGIAIGAYEEWTGSGNVIAGNYLGVHADGSSSAANGLSGVFLGYSATDNLIGGDTPADRNVISGNSLDGVTIHGSGTTANKVSGNFIGTNASGTATLMNGAYGVRVYGEAQDNTIGGEGAAERNLISGNIEGGVYILGADTSGNKVSGNFIGPDTSGFSRLGNFANGIEIVDAGGNTIGPHNLISGNNRHGVLIQGTSVAGNIVRENFIGSDAGGNGELANGHEGVYLLNADGNTIGPGNVLSGNRYNGIWVDGSDDNTIAGNYIGVGADGISPLENIASGVFIGGASQNNLVGGDSPAERNIISANDSYGIHLGDTNTLSNTIAGNYIGLGANGSTILGNGDGIRLESGVQGTIIGPGNVVSGNEAYGIWLTGPDTTANLIQGNYIGTNASGSSARANGSSGVALWSGASGNTVGGDTPGERNIISGNGEDGVEVVGIGTADNTISGNYIGTDASGSIAIGNGSAGVRIAGQAQDNIVGGFTAGERNILSGNLLGVYIGDEGTTGNYISGNYIGTSADRQVALGNQHNGVLITLYAQNNAIGPDNTIAHNGQNGVEIETPLAFGDLVLQNSIFDNFNLGIDLVFGANHDIQPPLIESSTVLPVTISGSTCTNCLVEVFSSQDDDGEGEFPLGHVMADSGGDFTLALDRLYYPYLTATASTLVDGTSEFSAVYIAQVQYIAFLPFVR